MAKVIWSIFFLIIGIAVVTFGSLLALVITAGLAAIAVGWLVTWPLRSKFRRWRNERRSQVR